MYVAGVEGKICEVINFEVVCIEILFKALELDEITQGGSSYKNKQTNKQREREKLKSGTFQY